MRGSKVTLPLWKVVMSKKRKKSATSSFRVRHIHIFVDGPYVFNEELRKQHVVIRVLFKRQGFSHHSAKPNTRKNNR
jgi:hypothetical protein